MGIAQSFPTRGQRFTIWFMSGVISGMAMANWIHLNTVISYEDKNSVECVVGATSNTTMREVNKYVCLFFLIVFIILTYYLFVTTSAQKKISEGLSKEGTLGSPIIGK